MEKTTPDTRLIRHSVTFRLKYPKGSAEEQEFLSAAENLSQLPGVKKFEMLSQTSKKNNFDYGISMEFESKAAYEQYNIHPDHQSFIENWWKKGVDDFMEIDYEPLKK